MAAARDVAAAVWMSPRHTSVMQGKRWKRWNLNRRLMHHHHGCQSRLRGSAVGLTWFAGAVVDLRCVDFGEPDDFSTRVQDDGVAIVHVGDLPIQFKLERFGAGAAQCSGQHQTHEGGDVFHFCEWKRGDPLRVVPRGLKKMAVKLAPHEGALFPPLFSLG